MSVPLGIWELAERFWADAGRRETFPRQLLEPLLWTSFTLTVESLPGLSTGKVEDYLARFGCSRGSASPDRPLRGCLVADNGGGWIFLDADDSPAERTFSLAHELAHFLLDYWRPRQRGRAAVGDSVLEVFDGQRAATVAERLHTLLHEIPLGSHDHLMERHPDFISPEILRAEQEADRLALELLAPQDEVKRRWNANFSLAEGTALLCQDFGLPPHLAEIHARQFLSGGEPHFLVARLQIARNSCRTSLGAREVEAGGVPHEPPA